MEASVNPNQPEKRKKYLPPEETAMFCGQVALILKSGIPLYDGVEALCENYKGSKYGAQFERLNELVKETGSLGQAAEGIGVFPPYMVNTIKIAERAGTTDTVMEALGVYYEREAQIKTAVTNALVYPMVLIAMMALVIVVLVIKVLPVFTQVFRNLGTEMSASSVAIMNFGLAAGKTILYVVVAIMVIGAALFILYKTKHKNRVLRFLSAVFPPFAQIRTKTTAARFASVTAMLMDSGFPMEETLKLVPDILTDEEARRKVEECGRRVEAGESFPVAIENSKIFTGIHNKMIRVGFMAGQMDGVMNKLAGIYEYEIDDGIRRMVSMIEPTLVAILSTVIGAVLLAVMLPLAGILSSL